MGRDRVLKTRLIPVHYLMNGRIVRSEGFRDFKVIGNPLGQLERLNAWKADELVYIDITRSGDHDLMRDDHFVKNLGDVVSILRAVARQVFMPLAFGGRIRAMEDVDAFIRNGADKVIVNSQAYREPDLVTRVARKYGSQAMIAGIDVKRLDGRLVLHIDQGRTPVDDDPADHARRLEDSGAGEILLNAIDRDGTARGYDIKAVAEIAGAVGIPVIACGGAGTFEHFGEVLDQTGAAAVAAGNIFHFTENAYRRAKRTLFERGYPVRYPYRRTP